jgi:hypothetical protein
MRWEDIPIGSRKRRAMIYGEEKPKKKLGYGPDRQKYAERISRYEPWGMKIYRFPNPHYAILGGFEARQPIAGGLWEAKVWGKKYVSDTIEELFLQIVEKMDEDRTKRPPARGIPVHSFVDSAARNRFGSFPDSDYQGRGPIIRSNKYTMPSARYYGKIIK